MSGFSTRDGYTSRLVRCRQGMQTIESALRRLFRSNAKRPAPPLTQHRRITMTAKTEGIADNAGRLLWAGFMAILAAGVGFAIRGGIFDNWGAEYGFTGAQLGAIGGAGFPGFCFGIIISGVICDKIGYGKLVILAFVLHVLSAFVTFTAKGDSAYTSLY